VKFIHYLGTHNELARVRPRAVLTTVGTVVLLVGGLGFVPAPDRVLLEGVAEPAQIAFVHAQEDGFMRDYLPSGRLVSPDGPPLARAQNAQLIAEHDRLLAERQRLVYQRRKAQTEDIATAQILREQIAALDESIRRADSRLAALNLSAPMAGTWVSPSIDQSKGRYLRRGEKLGLVASLEDVIIRAIAEQDVSALLSRKPVIDAVEIRVKGRPDTFLRGKRLSMSQVGQEHLPSPALGYAVGGPVVTASDDRRGLKAAERFFEIRVAPDPNSGVKLLSGQRVVVRFETSRKPLMVQWWRALRQLLQRRFHV
ncbi:hypothetical protein LCGC14_2340960, partial [marine sediment metagenome]